LTCAEDRKRSFQYERKPEDAQRRLNDEKFRVSFTVYRNTDLFQATSQSSAIEMGYDKDDSLHYQTVNSIVLSASVNGIKIENLTEPVAIVFRLKEVVYRAIQLSKKILPS
jgi:hypothetical protein